MSSSKVKSACDNAGLVTPCSGELGCQYNDKYCTLTSQIDCSNPMLSVSKEICNGKKPNQCRSFEGVYAYIANTLSGSACGVESGVTTLWCSNGNDYTNKSAFCAAKKGIFFKI